MTMAVATPTEIRSFQVDIPEQQIDDLRRRISTTHLPTKELVPDRSQGVQLATVQALADFWANQYDFGRVAARLNALPQFTTEIDGVAIHFIHVRSRHENALPLIMTHGWPGSVIELLGAIGPLTDPTAHGGTAEDAFHLVLPSLPGYGFSGEPAELGWDSGRTARAWAELMSRLGYERYVAQGGDVGALVTDLMGRQAVAGLAGYHLNLLTAVLAIGDHLPRETEQERAAAAAVATFEQDGFGYFLEMATRPQTIGYALLDSPVALAAWMLDHDTDSYTKISRAFVDGQPVGDLTRESVLDNITLYWLTGTATSGGQVVLGGRTSAGRGARQRPGRRRRSPCRSASPRSPARSGHRPRSWVEAVYPGLAYFNEADRGGHFAAWEEPETFAGRGAGGVQLAAVATPAKAGRGGSHVVRPVSGRGCTSPGADESHARPARLRQERPIPTRLRGCADPGAQSRRRPGSRPRQWRQPGRARLGRHVAAPGGTPRTPPIIPGHEVSGVVEAVGADAAEIAVGDAVYGYIDSQRDGADAEYVAVRADELAPKPATVDARPGRGGAVVGADGLAGACSTKVISPAASGSSSTAAPVAWLVRRPARATGEALT